VESLGSQLILTVDRTFKQFIHAVLSIKFVSLIIKPPTKRKKYEASFKLKVIKMAKESNNYAAAKAFDINMIS
jgi:hypothetical protein